MSKRFSTGAAALTAAFALAACDRDEPVNEPAPPVVAPATVPVAEPADENVTVDEATRAKFNTLLEQVTRHIRNREFEAAETGLREMEQMRGTITEPMKQQIVTTRAALTAARAAPAAPPAK